MLHWSCRYDMYLKLIQAVVDDRATQFQPVRGWRIRIFIP